MRLKLVFARENVNNVFGDLFGVCGPHEAQQVDQCLEDRSATSRTVLNCVPEGPALYVNQAQDRVRAEIFDS